MASPFVLFIAGLILVFFAANAILFMIARIREANRDQKNRELEESISDDEVDGIINL